MKPEKSSQELTRKAFAVVLLIAGITLLTGYAHELRHSPDSSNWPSVDGVVTESSVQSGGTHGRSYYPSVRYEYAVNGVRYRGSRITFQGRETGNQQRVVDRYPVGSVVRVHYRESDPGYSVLEPGPGRRQAILGMALSLLLVGAAALFWFRRLPS
jgi:hypothetical protein